MRQFNTTNTTRRLAAAALSLGLSIVLVMTLFTSMESEVKGSAAVMLIPESPIDSLITQLEPLPELETARVIGSGQASFYGPGFEGRRTANGEAFKPGAMTAAHKTLPFGTKLRVTNLRNGKSVVVRVNDRGPYVAHRIVDLSQGAASKIGMISSGTAQVRLEVLA